MRSCPFLTFILAIPETIINLHVVQTDRTCTLPTAAHLVLNPPHAVWVYMTGLPYVFAVSPSLNVPFRNNSMKQRPVRFSCSTTVCHPTRLCNSKGSKEDSYCHSPFSCILILGFLRLTAANIPVAEYWVISWHKMKGRSPVTQNQLPLRLVFPDTQKLADSFSSFWYIFNKSNFLAIPDNWKWACFYTTRHADMRARSFSQGALFNASPGNSVMWKRAKTSSISTLSAISSSAKPIQLQNKA